jgi:hypothetical protein
MSPHAIERSCYWISALGLAAPIGLSLSGFTGFRGDLSRLTSPLGLSLCLIGFVCGAYVGSERKKLAAIVDDFRRAEKEHQLKRNAAFVVVGLVAGFRSVCWLVNGYDQTANKSPATVFTEHD